MSLQKLYTSVSCRTVWPPALLQQCPCPVKQGNPEYLSLASASPPDRSAGGTRPSTRSARASWPAAKKHTVFRHSSYSISQNASRRYFCGHSRSLSTPMHRPWRCTAVLPPVPHLQPPGLVPLVIPVVVLGAAPHSGASSCSTQGTAARSSCEQRGSIPPAATPSDAMGFALGVDGRHCQRPSTAPCVHCKLLVTISGHQQHPTTHMSITLLQSLPTPHLLLRLHQQLRRVVSVHVAVVPSLQRTPLHLQVDLQQQIHTRCTSIAGCRST